jgi:hypothetical protein
MDSTGLNALRLLVVIYVERENPIRTYFYLMKNFMLVMTVAVATVLFAGCQKEEAQAARPTLQPKSPTIADLGVVEVSDGVEVRRDLSDGKVCVIMPKVLADGSVEMVISVSDPKLPKVRPSSMKVTTLSDQPVQISNGAFAFTLTARVKK